MTNGPLCKFQNEADSVRSPVIFPLLLLLQLCLLGYPMSTMSSCLPVAALLACHLCMTLHWMHQVQQWLHQMLSLPESRLSQEVENLIIQNRKVKGQTQSDRMCWLNFLLADFKSFSVCLLWLIHNPFLVITSSNLNQGTVVVLFYFQTEDFALCLWSTVDQELFQ